MHKKIIGLIGICFLLFGNCSYAEQTSVMPFKEIYIKLNPFKSGAARGVLVVNDEKKWKELWSQYPFIATEKVPSVDFSTETVLVVTSGIGFNTTISLLITSIDREPSRLVVHANVFHDLEHIGTDYIVDMVTIPKTDLPAILDVKVVTPLPPAVAVPQ